LFGHSECSKLILSEVGEEIDLNAESDVKRILMPVITKIKRHFCMPFLKNKILKIGKG